MENLTTMVGPKGVIKKHEFVRILIQCLYSLGYDKSAASLESESRISCKSSEFKRLESLVLGADWEGCIANIYGIKEMTDEQRDTALFLVSKQYFLECLGRGDDSLALSLLRKQISKLQVGREEVHMLAFGLLSLGELGLNKVHDDSDVSQELRNFLINELGKLIPPPITVPDRRLEHLVERVVGSQIDSCIYHNSLDHVSIYKDHRCGRDQIPTETVQILSAHKNEVWFVQFSNNGNYLASSSSDCTAIIWKVLEDSKLVLEHTLKSHQNPVSFVAWSPDDTMLLTCGNSEVLRLWDVETGMFGKTVEVYIWNRRISDPIEVLSGHSMTVNCVSWNPKRHRMLASASDDQTIRIWGPQPENVTKNCSYC
ncbi:hypothetical protein L1987_50609 [Smallanthus sonchifolius]|uniref:Uncharacterized protein n=1 Tax=Smallanthus sonchifolius TaxID=185202 RepID=A0ACB9ENS6_9ASTR|nr:hypothetical protein L1987_50609 [Smallanthus sonchifolius]